ncbi:MAG: hypothetical protein P8L85_10325 [Rubripirellula sp.]|nr:hypothetical protein [Rubripirellula sp.]
MLAEHRKHLAVMILIAHRPPNATKNRWALGDLSFDWITIATIAVTPQTTAIVSALDKELESAFIGETRGRCSHAWHSGFSVSLFAPHARHFCGALTAFFFSCSGTGSPGEETVKVFPHLHFTFLPAIFVCTKYFLPQEQTALILNEVKVLMSEFPFGRRQELNHG